MEDMLRMNIIINDCRQLLENDPDVSRMPGEYFNEYLDVLVRRRVESEGLITSLPPQHRDQDRRNENHEIQINNKRAKRE